MHSFSAVKLVEAFIGNISHRSWDNLPAFFTPDATWWISGTAAILPPGFPCGDSMAQEHLPNLPALTNQFETYEYNIVNIVGRGNKVMVEGQAIGRGPADLVYINNIASSYEVTHRGKITKVREYPDNGEITWLMDWLKNHGDESSGCPLY